MRPGARPKNYEYSGVDMKNRPTPTLTHAIQSVPEWGDAKKIAELYGLCKSTLYRLADEGKIRSSSLRERGKLRGKRLFSCSSIAAYIESMAKGGEEA